MNTKSCFSRFLPLVTALAIGSFAMALIRPVSLAATTATATITKTSSYATSVSRQKLVAVVRSSSVLRDPQKIPLRLQAEAKIVDSHLSDPSGDPVTEDVTGKCSGEVRCEACDIACRDYKFGMFLIKLMDSLNDDGSWDDAIQHIEDYTTSELTDFNCTCSGL